MKAQNNIHNTLPANRNWQITIWIFAFTVLALLFVNNNALAIHSEFEDENYIDDIPFDTHLIVVSSGKENSKFYTVGK